MAGSPLPAAPGKVPRWVPAVATACLLMLTLLTIPPPPTTLWCDPSYGTVLSFAHREGLQYGTDLVTTYGPAGFLIYYYYSPHAAFLRLITDLLLGSVIAGGICWLAWRLRLLPRILLLVLCGFGASNLEPRTDLLIYLGFLSWGLLCWLETGRKLAAAVAVFAVFSAFCGLAKTSFLMLALFGVGMLWVDLALRRQWRLAGMLAAAFVATFLLGWLLLGQKLSGLPQFLRSLVAVVGVYNQTSSLEGLPRFIERGWITGLLALAVVGARTLVCDTQKWRCATALAWNLGLLFLVWKHGFVRGDASHVVFFFGFALVLGFALDALPCRFSWVRTAAFGATLACALVAGWTLQTAFFPPLKQSLWQPFRAFGIHLRSLVVPGCHRREMEAAWEQLRQQADLPRLRETIQSSTVDVFGCLQSYAWFNQLNYRPRPVFQSYTACGRVLTQLNHTFYLSNRAPEFVLFCLGVMDHKLPALEDALVLRHLLSSYRPVAAEGPFLLLRAKPAAPEKVSLVHFGSGRLRERIELPDEAGSELWMELKVELNWLGRLRSLLYQPPVLRLAVWPRSEESNRVRLRAPVPMLAGGFLVSPLFLSNEDVAAHYSRSGARESKAFALEPHPGSDRFWKSELSYRIYKVEAAVKRE
jgi:hypothetical protein